MQELLCASFLRFYELGGSMIKLTDEIRTRIANGETDLLYKTTAWKDKREMILKRDHYTCQRCLGVYKVGSPVKHIRIRRANTVHHKDEVSSKPELILDDDNLISVCHKCHNEIHGRTTDKFNKPKKIINDERW